MIIQLHARKMAFYTLLLLALVSLQQLQTLPTQCEVIIVNSESEINNTSNTTVCTSLEEANGLLNGIADDYVTVIIEGHVTLHSVFHVIKNNVRIMGSSPYDLLSVQCGPGDAGFVIDYVKNFSVVNLAIRNCTMQYNDSNEESYFFGMLIKESSSVLFQNIRFEYCRQTALILMNNKEYVTIENSSFAFNGKYFKRKTSHSGGALSILQNVNNTNQAVNYTIKYCNFTRNVAPVVDMFDSTRGTLIKNNGYGGGVFIEFGGKTTNSAVNIFSSHFTSNAAARGGGVYAYYTQQAHGNNIRLTHSMLNDNYGNLSGGAINIGYRSSPSYRNKFAIDHCYLEGNYGYSGGGLGVYSFFDNETTSGELEIVVSNTIWQKNRGVLGAAVDITPLGSMQIKGYLPVPVFSNCTFRYNTVNAKTYRSNKTNHANIGVFAVTQFKTVIRGKTVFEQNYYSALSLVSAVVVIHRNSHILFYNNIGSNGGAVAMFGFSAMIFERDTHTNFSKNHAHRHGGAIYFHTIDQHNFQKTSTQCFLGHMPNNLTTKQIDTVKVFFNNNVADVGGAAIYSESFHACYQSCSGNQQHSQTIRRDSQIVRREDVFKCIGKFSFNDHTENKQTLMSSGRTFVFDANGTLCQNHTACEWKDKRGKARDQFYCKIIPGNNACLPFYVVDDLGNTVKPLIGISQVSKKGSIHAHRHHNVFVKDPYSLTNTMRPFGEPHASSEFIFSVQGVRQIYFYVNVKLLPCPPGYHSASNSCTCAAGAKDGYAHITRCDDTTFQAYYGDDLWVGYIPEDSLNYTSLYFSSCVNHLCNLRQHHLNQNGENLAKAICNTNRKGIMCGKCTLNHSNFYHSKHYKCGSNKYCHLGILFYVLFEIIPVVTFFVVVVTFDFSFTSGGAVGFIFFAQYLDFFTTLHVTLLISYIRVPYQLVYGLFNLEFSTIEELSFCPWSGAEILDVMVLKFLTAAVAFGLVMALVVLLRNDWCKVFCRMRSRISTKTSVVNGLSTFLIICYSQCTKTSFYILKYTIPVGYRGIIENHYSFYGGLPYFHKRHLLYAIPALVSLVFVTILPPLVLLLYPLSLQLLSLCGLSEHWIVNKALQLTGINKLMPFIDCFQSCYRDKLRFFAGLYFVYRVAFLLMYNWSSNSFYFSIFSQVFLVTFLGIHAIVQPYKKKVHNTIDALLFFNLALINGCSIMSKEIVRQLDNPKLVETSTTFIFVIIVQLFLHYLPCLVLVGKLVICLRLKCRKPHARNIPVDDVLDGTSDRTLDGNSDCSSEINHPSLNASWSEKMQPKQYGSI